MAEATYLQAIRQALIEEMERDERVVVFGEDVAGPKGGVFRVTEGLPDRFGEERIFNSPLAEASIVGVGIGAAMAGLRPVVEIQFADFIYPAMDQIVNEAARIRYRSNNGFECPMVIRVPYGGGIHGALYHSQSPETMFAHVPGLKVCVPGTPRDARGLLKSAVRDDDPVLFFEHKKLYRSLKEELPEEDELLPIGRARVVQPGERLTIFSYGAYLQLALQVKGVEVVDLRCLTPLDKETICESVKRTSRALVLYEPNLSYGAGAEVAAVIAEECFEYLDAPVTRLASPDVPAMPFSTQLEEAFVLDGGDVRAAAEKLLAY